MSCILPGLANERGELGDAHCHRMHQAGPEQCSIPTSQAKGTNHPLHCQGGLQQLKQERDGVGMLQQGKHPHPLGSTSASAKQAQRWFGSIRRSCRELIDSYSSKWSIKREATHWVE